MGRTCLPCALAGLETMEAAMAAAMPVNIDVDDLERAVSDGRHHAGLPAGEGRRFSGEPATAERRR
jgi:hypothetical protein